MDEHPHIAAIVLSGGARKVRPPQPPQGVMHRRGLGVFRRVTWDRHHTTLIIPGPAANTRTIALLDDLVRYERRLLNATLKESTGVPTHDHLVIGDSTTAP